MAEPAVKQPITTWRERIIRAGAIVAKPWRRYRAAAFQGYLVLAILLFAVLAVLAHSIAYFTFDVVITRDVQTINIVGFAALMQFVSSLGFAPQADILAALIIAFIFITGLRWEAVMSAFAAVGISVIGTLVKILVQRPRPSSDLVHVFAQLHDFSFPSGHVLFFTAFYGFLLFLSYTLLKPSWGRAVLLAFFGGLVGLVGISRIYLGQHWASDVLAAYLLSSVWLYLSVHLYRWGKPRFFTNQPIAREKGQDLPVTH
jgi:undecaprenyl-diphosphatase